MYVFEIRPANKFFHLPMNVLIVALEQTYIAVTLRQKKSRKTVRDTRLLKHL